MASVTFAMQAPRHRAALGRGPEPAHPVERGVFLALIGLAVVVHLALIVRPIWGEGSDGSVVYLMAVHASRGQLTPYYWGQSYGGTLLSIIAGATMFAFGPHLGILQLISTGVFAAILLVIRSIGRWTLSARAGDLAAALFAFPGIVVAPALMADPGFYGTGIALALTAIWLVVRGERRKPHWQWLLIGVSVGAAFWQLPLAALMALPAVVVLVLGQLSVTRWLAGAAGAVIGATPALVMMMRTGTIQTSTNPRIGVHLAESLLDYFRAMLPAAFTLGTDSPAIARESVGVIALALLVALVVLAVVRRSRTLAAVAAAGPLTALGTAVGAASDISTLTRYAVFICPFLALAIGALLDRWPIPAIGAAVLAGALTIAPVDVMMAEAPPRSALLWTAEAPAIASAMRADGVTAAYGDYWIAYRFTASQNETLTMAALVPRRYAPYETAAAAEEKTLVVVLAGAQNDGILAEQPEPHSRALIGQYALYTFPSGFDPYRIHWGVN